MDGETDNSLKEALQELEATRARLAEVEENLRAIRAGEVDAIIATGPDGGEQVYTLRGADYTYRVLVEHMNQAAAIASDNGAILFTNAKFEILTGTPSEKASSLPVESFFPESSLKEFRQLLHRSLQGDAGGELSLVDARGRLMPVYASLNRVKLGDVSAICLLLTDLTEQKRNEEILAEGRLASAILEQMGETTVVCDPEGKILRASRVTGGLCGCEPVGLPFALVFPLELEGAGLFDLAGVSPGGRVDRTARYRSPEGGVMHFQVIAKSLVTETGAHLGWVVSLADITAHKEVEQELRSAREAAQQASQAKSAFLAQMSHEIRTPMNGIIGMTELALMENLPPRAANYLGLVKRSAKSLLDIINDILDLSKIEAGKRELSEEDFDLSEAVETVISTLELLAAEKDLSLRAHISPEVRRLVRGDRGMLAQVLTNLLGNAIKFTLTGSVTVRVENAASGPEGAVSFEVRDTGIGIEKSKLDTIFESFAQAGGAGHHARYGGTGLGLAISRRLVRLMGGELKVESEPGRGSAFRFTVPLKPPGEKRASAEAPGRKAGVPKSAPLRILLAEDNPINQLVGKDLLESDGHTVSVAANGRLALEALSREPFDLVLMDVQMPEMDGPEATRRIRAGEVPGVPVNIPIIALSAHALRGDRERFLEAGMDDYLSKPIYPEELYKIIHNLGKGVPKPDAFGRAKKVLGRLPEEKIKPILEQYFRSGADRLAELRNALRQGDAESLSQSAHSLRGSNLVFGTDRMVELSAALEQKGTSGNIEGAGELLDELDKEFRSLMDHFERGGG